MSKPEDTEPMSKHRNTPAIYKTSENKEPLIKYLISTPINKEHNREPLNKPQIISWITKHMYTSQWANPRKLYQLQTSEYSDNEVKWEYNINSISDYYRKSNKPS